MLLSAVLDKLADIADTGRPNIEVINQPVPGMDKVLTVLAATIKHSIFPLVRSMDKKLEIDLRTHDKMKAISQQLRDLEAELSHKPSKESSE